MNTHISKIVGTCFSILRHLRSVARSLPRHAKRQLVQTFVLSHVDYFNVSFAVIPKRPTDRLQAIVNASARLVSGTRKFDHITLVLRDDSHLLRVPERIEFKLCLLVHKCLPAQRGAKLLARTHQAAIIQFISIKTAVIDDRSTFLTLIVAVVIEPSASLDHVPRIIFRLTSRQPIVS
jgi:hypothetical protein